MNLLGGTNQFLRQGGEGKNGFWRYLLTLALVTFLTFSAQAVLLLAVIFSTGTLDLSKLPPITYLAVVMLPFGFVTVGLYIGVRFIHQRRFKSMITAAPRFRWGRLLLSAGIWFGLSVLSDLISSILSPGNVTWTFDARKFLPFLVAALVLVPIQISAEEFLFRGYLTQAFGQLSRGIMLPLVFPAVLFGLLHGMNPEVGAYGMAVMMAYYIGMGLFMGGITLFSQGLELSLGVHLATNLYATLIMTFPGSSIPSPALFTAQAFDPLSGLVVFAIMTVLYLLLVFGAGRRRSTIEPTGNQETAD